MKLKDFQITKNDTCLTYAVKRIGLDFDFCNYHTLREEFDFENYYDFSLSVGDILFWDQKMEWDWMPTEIISGKIISHRVPVKFHFAVYEGNGIISDCTRLDYNPHPSLRFRNINNIEEQPNWILRIKKNKI